MSRAIQPLKPMEHSEFADKLLAFYRNDLKHRRERVQLPQLPKHTINAAVICEWYR